MEPGKIVWATNLRALALFAMIIVHVSNAILHQFGTLPDYIWWTGNIYEGTFRFCVPVFLMLSGALLLAKVDTPAAFLKKRMSRVVFPFLFWSMLYIIYHVNSEYQNGQTMNFIEVGKYIVLKYKNGPAFHLWYVYMIMGLYLFFPIIGKWIRNSTEKEQLYFITIWMVTCVIYMPVINKIVPAIELSYFSGYIGYPVLGYFLANTSFRKSAKQFSILLFVTGITITIVGTFLIANYKGSFYNALYVYLTPNVMMAAIGVFLFVKQTNFSNTIVLSVSAFISRYSYGIYLAHVLVLFFLYRLKIDWSFIHPIVGIPITAVLCLSISAGVVYVLNKLPFGKYIAG
jgi:surface polysaccharide O-acyltransferase-like enzyme